MDASRLEDARGEHSMLNGILDRRPTCRGVWLEAGELEQMRDTIEDGLTKALVQGMVIPG